MKALKYFASALALVALFTSCEEEDKYVQAELPNTMEAYFPATTMTVSMEELTTGFDVEIARVNYDEAATATLTCTRPAGVNVPSTVSFAAGQEKTEFTVSVDQAAVGQGKTLEIELYVDTESKSPYANQRCVVTLTTWSPVPPASWEPIETQALFVEGASVASEFFGTESGFTFPVYVEKLQGSEVYRIANLFSTYTSEAGVTYSHPYWYYYIDESYLEDAENVHYTYIDCEGYYWDEADKASWKKGWAFMPLQSQNFGLNPPAYGYNQWGSFGYTFNGQTPSDTNMGKYNEANKSITFASGSLVMGMSAYNGGGWYTSGVNFVLFLDQNLAGTDFERDCAFSKLQDATLKSAILEDKWTVALHEGVPADEEKAAEYAEKFGQVIKVENAYVEGFPIYFCVNAEGKISVPEDYESQAMGLSIAGFDLYLNVKKGEYANNSYSLLCEMVGVDPTGAKADVVYGEYTEVISLETAVAAESIDEFCGEWVFNGVDYNNGEAFSYAAAIEKVSETEAKLKYLLDGSGSIDDGITLTFADGVLSLLPQDLGISNNGYDIQVNTLGMMDGELYFFEPATEEFPIALGMIAQLTDSGNIKFVDDAAQNAKYGVEIVAFYYAAYQNGEHMGRFTDYFSSIEMNPASDAAVKAAPAFAVTGLTKFDGQLVEREREYFINGQKASKKSTGKVTPTFRPSGNFVEMR